MKNEEGRFLIWLHSYPYSKWRDLLESEQRLKYEYDEYRVGVRRVLLVLLELEYLP